MTHFDGDDPFSGIHHIDSINGCIQCGTCSGSCPLSDRMDHAPRELFALIREGAYDEVLHSETPWFCVSCYACMVRCPREIPVTDLMYGLKETAVRLGTIPGGHKMPHMYRAFSRTIRTTGKVTESWVMGRYGMQHPLDALKQVPLGIRMLRRGRLEHKPQKTADPDAFTRLFELTENGEDTP
jgi:heterodisulfide reductase subunit C